MRVLQAKWNSKEKKKNFKQNKKENINDYIISFVLILSVLWSNKQIRFAYTIPASWLYYLFLYLINSLDLFNIRHDTRWLHTCLWIIHLLYIHVQFLSLFRSIVDRNIFLNFKRRIQRFEFFARAVSFLQLDSSRVSIYRIRSIRPEDIFPSFQACRGLEYGKQKRQIEFKTTKRGGWRGNRGGRNRRVRN